MTEARRPTQLVVLLTASAGLYSVSLAGIAALQSNSDQATMAARVPTELALRGLTAESDRLSTALERAAEVYAGAGAHYDALAPELATAEEELQALAARVAKVSGTAADLPNSISVPRLTRSTKIVTRTVVHATTGASG
jgi:hypothetical protein